MMWIAQRLRMGTVNTLKNTQRLINSGTDPSPFLAFPFAGLRILRRFPLNRNI